jgi:hypothetical protein
VRNPAPDTSWFAKEVGPPPKGRQLVFFQNFGFASSQVPGPWLVSLFLQETASQAMDEVFARLVEAAAHRTNMPLEQLPGIGCGDFQQVFAVCPLCFEVDPKLSLLHL